MLAAKSQTMAAAATPTRWSEIPGMERAHASQRPAPWGPDALIMTTNGGASWRRLGLPHGATFFAAMFFASAPDGWALVSAPSTNPLFGNEALFATSDGGRRWVEIDRDLTYPYRACVAWRSTSTPWA